MQIQCFTAQFPVSASVPENLAQMRRMMNELPPRSWVVFPEGALSGYDHDMEAFLKQLDPKELRAGLHEIAALARQQNVYTWFGSLWAKENRWWNITFGITPQGQRFTYTKVNLATNERGVLKAGDSLSVMNVPFDGLPVPVGVQMCRDLRYPEQWRWLAVKGAQLFLHPTYALSHPDNLPVWRSHLVSRAAENQRFVVSVNASGAQNSPSIIVAPSGRVLAEMDPHTEGMVSAVLDLTEADDTYLRQTRRDLVKVTGN